MPFVVEITTCTQCSGKCLSSSSPGLSLYDRILNIEIKARNITQAQKAVEIFKYVRNNWAYAFSMCIEVKNVVMSFELCM